MKTGFYPDINIEDYHNWEKYPALSSSLIGALVNKSPMHARAIMDDKVKNETKAKIFGSVSHDILLQNNISNYELQPADIKVRRGQKWDEFVAHCEATGKTPLKEPEMEQLIGMHDALMANPIAKAIIENNTDIELSGFWERSATIKGKMRTDIINEDILVWSDYKTTTDASPEGFSKHFFNYGYDVQAAWYSEGIREIKADSRYKAVYIAQEKEPPYAVGVFEIKPETINIGKVKIEYALKIFDKCLESGVWPGYPDMTKIINFGWAVSNAEGLELRLKEM